MLFSFSCNVTGHCYLLFYFLNMKSWNMAILSLLLRTKISQFIIMGNGAFRRWIWLWRMDLNAVMLKRSSIQSRDTVQIDCFPEICIASTRINLLLLISLAPACTKSSTNQINVNKMFISAGNFHCVIQAKWIRIEPDCTISSFCQETIHPMTRKLEGGH